MPEPLTVYTLPNCIQCTLTRQALDNAGLHYETVDLVHDQAGADLVTQLGYRSAPVVITDADHWTGFRPDKINAIAAAHAAALTLLSKEENA
ncbi:glutaredoxin domain-containing protein [Cryobacterium sp. HLT2-28]|uniref:glutaredoxin domain-containing protein n=1 Tax=Cryobacterium sp. HLT2-28 TaxID=1259146 RepID=UPI00106A704D|nr:glutaredoxin domain-containing protein [Cryobacterium sp. HLT2-28]TFB91561.1 NrdH-redoxin [Cryobacterium sp. HLT2-28]